MKLLQYSDAHSKHFDLTIGNENNMFFRKNVYVFNLYEFCIHLSECFFLFDSLLPNKGA